MLPRGTAAEKSFTAVRPPKRMVSPWVSRMTSGCMATRLFREASQDAVAAEHRVPGELALAHEALAPEQDDEDQGQREDHHAHAGNARELPVPDADRVLHDAQPLEHDRD